MPAPARSAEVVCIVLLLGYLLWVPMPFGSTTAESQTALILPPLLICAAAAILRWTSVRPFAAPPSLRVWSAGALLFACVVALQLVPLPSSILGVLSPESLHIWSDAARVSSLGGVAAPGAYPVSVDPQETALHLFRVIAYTATFLSSAFLFRRDGSRTALACTLGAAALFEALYGVREAALERYAIWGWRNWMIFNRVTGTFVNPNHFAHYAAIILPLGVYVSATAWREAAPPAAPLRVRVVRVVEKRLIRFASGMAIVFACLVAILVAQSRGALAATVAGVAIVGALMSGRRRAAQYAVLGAIGVLALAAIIATALGLKVSRFGARNEFAGFGGRTPAVHVALDLWKKFPLLGSGLGTFADVSPMFQTGDPELLLNHAHNDYAEVLATTGVAGAAAAILPLFAGVVLLARSLFDPRNEISWRRRAFTIAALTSIAIALVHALIDFNFFIPANPATFAAIAGAAVSLKETR